MKNCLLPGIKPSMAHVKSAIEAPLWSLHSKHPYDKLSSIKHYFLIDLFDHEKLSIARDKT